MLGTVSPDGRTVRAACHIRAYIGRAIVSGRTVIFGNSASDTDGCPVIFGRTVRRFLLRQRAIILDIEQSAVDIPDGKPTRGLRGGSALESRTLRCIESAEALWRIGSVRADSTDSGAAAPDTAEA